MKDEIIAACLRTLPAVLKFIKSAPVGAIGLYFENESETASDHDELILMNDVIQQDIATQLAPLMRPDWQLRYSQFVERAEPQWAPLLP